MRLNTKCCKIVWYLEMSDCQISPEMDIHSLHIAHRVLTSIVSKHNIIVSYLQGENGGMSMIFNLDPCIYQHFRENYDPQYTYFKFSFHVYNGRIVWLQWDYDQFISVKYRLINSFLLYPFMFSLHGWHPPRNDLSIWQWADEHTSPFLYNLSIQSTLFLKSWHFCFRIWGTLSRYL